jgi:hypothetical protein
MAFHGRNNINKTLEKTQPPSQQQPRHTSQSTHCTLALLPWNRVTKAWLCWQLHVFNCRTKTETMFRHDKLAFDFKLSLKICLHWLIWAEWHHVLTGSISEHFDSNKAEDLPFILFGCCQTNHLCEHLHSQFFHVLLCKLFFYLVIHFSFHRTGSTRGNENTTFDLLADQWAHKSTNVIPHYSWDAQCACPRSDCLQHYHYVASMVSIKVGLIQ